MKPPDNFESLWQQLQPEERPSAQATMARARAWQRRERLEQGLAFVALAATVIFMACLAYRFYPAETFLPPLGLALFLIFAMARAWRYLRSLRRTPQSDLYQTLTQQRRAALRLQRFIYRLYLPGLTAGVIAGLWVMLGQQSLEMFLGGSAATLAWVLFVTWWGGRRQARKMAKLDEVLQQLESGE